VIDRGQLKTLHAARLRARSVPADYVAEAIARLSADAGAWQTFHLTAGEGNMLRLDELVDIFLRERLARCGCSESLVEPPRFETAARRRSAKPAARTLCSVPHLSQAFDDGNTRALLNGYAPRPAGNSSRVSPATRLTPNFRAHDADTESLHAALACHLFLQRRCQRLRSRSLRSVDLGNLPTS